MASRASKSRKRSPLYIDAFAGPGVYKDGADGSPIVAIKAVLDHSLDISTPIRMSFIEKDPARCDILRSKLAKFQDQDRKRVIVEDVMNTSCQDGLRDLIHRERETFGSLQSAFIFLDQFGYSAAPMDLIGEIMNGDSCEAFIYLDYTRMNHTLTDLNKQAALTRTFGSQTWAEASNLEGKERVAFLRDSYKSALRRAGAEYVWDFEMRGKNDELLSWLFFCTSSDKGLEVMKRAMYRLDVTGNFRFSDRHVGQLNLLAQYFDFDWLANHLHEHYVGQTVPYGDIGKFVLTETPQVAYKKALGKLETSSRLRVLDPPKGRRRGTFKLDESALIEFLPNPGEQPSLF